MMQKYPDVPGDFKSPVCLDELTEAPLVTPDKRWMYAQPFGWIAIPQGGALDMTKGTLHWYDDYSGPFLSATNGLLGSRSLYVVASGATFARLSVNGGAGRITLAGDDADAVAVYGPLAYEPDEAGRIWLKVRVRSSSVAAGSIFIGFTDELTDTVIIEDEDGTIQTVASDAFGILLEGEQDGTWQTMGVGNDVDDTQYASTNINDPIAATWTTIFIEADNQGNAAKTVVRYRVWVDGKILKTSNTDTAGWTASVARSSIVYAPVVSGDDRATAYTVDICEFESDGGLGTTLD